MRDSTYGCALLLEQWRLIRSRLSTHHSFEVSPEVFDKACKLFNERGIRVPEAIVYRERGFFLGREMYFLDPSGNLLELCDPTWKPGMPTPTYEEIVDA